MLWGTEGDLWDDGWADAPPQMGNGARQIRVTKHFMDLRGMLPSLPTKKTVMANLVILVVFWLLWSSLGGPLG